MNPAEVFATAVSWLERAVPVVKAARFGLLVGVCASLAAAVAAAVGFAALGAGGGWLILVVPFCVALLVPALILWRSRAAMAAVLDLPAAIRDLDDLDDDLKARVVEVQTTARHRGGVVGAVRTAASLVGEVRGTLDDELAPFAAAVATLVPARLVFAAGVLAAAFGGLVVGLLVLMAGVLF